MNTANPRPVPTEARATGWSGLLVGITLLLAFSLPLEQMAYHAELTHPLLLGMRWTGYLVFGLDLIRRWRAAEYRREGGRVWLLLDAAAALPVGPLAFALAPAAPAGLLSLLHLLPILRLVRVYLAARHWQQDNPSRTGLRRIATTLVAIGLLIHWVGCWQMAVYDNTEQRPFLMHYLNAVYWTTTTMTTIGYGDITPDKTKAADLLFTMLVMVIGAGAFGFVIGNIATIMANIDFARNQHLERMQRLHAFMRYNKVPGELHERINRYYAYLWNTRKGFDEATVLADLPPALRREVEMHLRRDIVAKVPFFRGADNAMLHAVVAHLRPRTALPGERIIRKGDIGDSMYFIASGAVEVLGPDGETPVATLTDGHFFGEIALLERRPRGADVRATDFCDLYTLEKSALDEVIERHPEFGHHIRAMADARKQATA